MKILLTGHKGFIGSHMLTALEQAGHDVSTYEWDEVLKPTVAGQDWVVHVGAISSTTERDVDKIMRQNYDFSVDLYRECRFHEINFQYASSASVYGLVSEFKETSPVDPRTPYAWSKYMFERYVEKFPPKSSVVQGFRYFNVYGPEGENHKGNQASPHNQFLKQAEANKEIRVFENSEKYQRDFVPVSKIVETHIKFMHVPESGVWNVGTGSPQSFMDVANLYNVPVVTIPMPDILKDSYQKYTCADMTKYNETLKKYETRSSS